MVDSARSALGLRRPACAFLPSSGVAMARACTTTASSVHGLPPIVGPAPTVLILGSMPGVESLRQQQYYAHPRNAFWDLLGELFGARRELPYDGRRQVLTARGIAVWDVARECIRPGSLDSDIRNAQPNDFARFFHDHPTLRAVFFNGQKAAQMFDRLPAAIFIAAGELRKEKRAASRRRRREACASQASPSRMSQ